jgi:hypothetical protein
MTAPLKYVFNTDTGRDDPGSGDININLTDSAGDGLVIYTNAGLRQNGQAMLRLKSDNPAYNDPLLWIKRVGGNSNPEIRIDSGNPNIEMVDTTQDNAHGAGKFEIATHGDQFQINGRAADNSTFESIILLDRPCKGLTSGEQGGKGVVYIQNQGSVLFMNKASDHGTGFKAPDTLTGTTVYKLPAKDGLAGQALKTDGKGNLFWG